MVHACVLSPLLAVTPPRCNVCILLHRPSAGLGVKILRDIVKDGHVLIIGDVVMSVTDLAAWGQPPHSLKLIEGVDYKLKGGAVGGESEQVCGWAGGKDLGR